MEKINFMRKEDIDIVNNNVKDLMEKARLMEITITDPTLSVINEVRKHILNYIKKNKRIIYGGYAWNSLIKKISPNDVFYKSTEFIDIEFYSNKPIEDMKNICETC